ncbi:hypothetical protein V6260_19620, partial [Pseudoalteromonas aliena]
LHSNTPNINTINTFNTLEIKPIIALFAAQHFKLPIKHSNYIQCAEQYITQCSDHCNVNTIDIFSGEYH